MSSLFRPASSQISINVSTMTVTTTAEAGRLPLSLTLSSGSEGTMRTASSVLDEERENEKAVEPNLKQEDDIQATYPYFPTHPFRNARHARCTSTSNAPPPIQLFALGSDPCPFPAPPRTPSRRASSPSLPVIRPSTRFTFAKLLHFIPAGSKKQSRKENQRSEASGYHYQRVQDRLQQEKKRTENGEKSPSALWRSEGYW